MEVYATPTPETPSSVTQAVTEAVMKGTVTDDGDFAALIGGIVGGVLLLMICVITVLLWCLSRQKGSYVTNETDDIDDDGDGDDDDDESVGSDTALQSKASLKDKDEE